jgi:copper(I)-binding protein
VNTTPKTNRIFRIAAVAALVGLGLTACGDDKDEATSSSDGPAAQVGANEVAIEGAWARTSPAAVTMGAAYMKLTAAEDDALLAVEVDATIAAEAQIHEVVMVDSAMSDDTMAMSDDTMAMSEDTMAMTDDTMGGEMTMQQIQQLDLPAGETVELKPGSYHIMLLDLVKPLELGQTFTVELIFEKAGTKSVQVTVADDAP